MPATHDEGDDGDGRDDLIVAVQADREESTHDCHTGTRGQQEYLSAQSLTSSVDTHRGCNRRPTSTRKMAGSVMMALTSVMPIPKTPADPGRRGRNTGVE